MGRMLVQASKGRARRDMCRRRFGLGGDGSKVQGSAQGAPVPPPKQAPRAAEPRGAPAAGCPAPRRPGEGWPARRSRPAQRAGTALRQSPCTTAVSVVHGTGRCRVPSPSFGAGVGWTHEPGPLGPGGNARLCARCSAVAAMRPPPPIPHPPSSVACPKQQAPRAPPRHPRPAAAHQSSTSAVSVTSPASRMARSESRPSARSVASYSGGRSSGLSTPSQ